MSKEATGTRGFNGMHKVPGRAVYCDTWRCWLAEVVLCYVVYKLSPPPTPIGVPTA